MELLTQVGYYIENHLYATIGATTLGISIIRLLVSAIIFGPIGRAFVRPGPAAQRDSTIRKFQESAWFFIYYTATFSYGIYFLYFTEWLWDADHYWIGHPNQPYPLWMKLWYIFQTGNYISAQLFITIGPLLSARAHHKDFYIMFIHHFVTVALLALSHVCGYFRVGSIVLVVHDVSDIFLEFGKCANYLGGDKIKNHIFTVFGVVFFISRLIIYPLHVLYPVIFRSRVLMEYVPYWRLWDILLGTLQVLHIYWFYLIVKMATRLAKTGDAVNDIRSDDEDEPASSKKSKKAKKTQ